MLRILYLHWSGDIPLVLPCYPEHLSIGRAILITPDVLSTQKGGGGARPVPIFNARHHLFSSEAYQKSLTKAVYEFWNVAIKFMLHF